MSATVAKMQASYSALLSSTKLRFRPTQEGIVLLLACALFVGFSVTLHGFLSLGNIAGLVKSVSVLGILGLGMGLVVLVRGIDLAMVSTMVVSTSWAFILPAHGLPFWLSLLAAGGFALLVGMAIGVLSAYAEIPSIFTTLAMSAIVYGLGRTFFFQVDGQNVPEGHPWFTFIGRGSLLGLPMPIVAFAGLALALSLILRSTRFGRFVYAVGDNPLSARLTGLPVRTVMVAAFVGSGLLAYLAGLVSAASVSQISTRLFQSTLIYDVLLVVVLGGIGLSGGRGGVRNVIVGTMLVGILLNGMTIMNLSYTVQNIGKAIILLGAILIDTIVNPRNEQTSQQGDI
jgi:ribose transport system permease protein